MYILPSASGSLHSRRYQRILEINIGRLANPHACIVEDISDETMLKLVSVSSKPFGKFPSLCKHVADHTSFSAELAFVVFLMARSSDFHAESIHDHKSITSIVFSATGHSKRRARNLQIAKRHDGFVHCNNHRFGLDLQAFLQGGSYL
jgi:hypothetical protein